MLKAVLAALALVVCAGVALVVLSSHTTLAFDPAPKAIGESTPIVVHIANPHGTRHVVAAIEQNGARKILAESTKPATRVNFVRAHQPAQDLHFALGKFDLKEGKARLVVEAQSNDLRGSTDSIASDVDVVFRPPSVSADGFQHYINQGGSEMAILTVTGSWTEAGVRVGDMTFPSFPLEGNQRVALFAYPWDLPRDTAPFVYAKNIAGDQAKSQFWFKVFPKKFHARDLQIDDRFLDKVVNQIDPNGSGDLLERFLKINGQMRRENNATLAALQHKTADKFLWKEPFLQLANSQVESGFADIRSYIYKGKKVDQQTHLGFDLAVNAHTPVLAANDGTIVWAAPLGIYGNCVVIDHGLTLQSIYAHLSEIGVKEGDSVKRGDTLGKSGSTGLAGGDHLHYSMQIGGVQVNPVEWWDGHWIHDHVTGRLHGESAP
jgi:murein DD-endopeptidase MepM/ murein hydrolase activator NlpD